MTKLAEILNLINALSKEDLDYLKKTLSSDESSQNITEYVKACRFSQGRVCPICGCINIVRYGHTDNKQRYKCKDCGKTFVITTNSCIERTHKEMSVWEKYIRCMIDGFSVRKSAEICGIHRNTAFIWRHKILDALQIIQDSIVIDGIAEADETFMPVSYKGNHKKSKIFVMPRPSRHRGKDKLYDENGNWVKKKVALSFNLVCVPCMVNRNGLSVAKVGKLGKLSNECINATFDTHIKNGIVLCTDGEKSYRKFAEKHTLQLYQVKGTQKIKEIYHIQHINSYHSNLKAFLRKFKGVSTKYLNNYLVWNNLINYSKQSLTEKERILLEHTFTIPFKERFVDVSARNPIPIAN